MASYSDACLGLPWRTAALDRLLWQDEAARYAVHGLALFLLVGVAPRWDLCRALFEFDAAPRFLTRDQ